MKQEERKHWHKYLREITFAYNTSVNETTGTTPYKLVFCKDPVIDADTLMDTFDVEDIDEHRYKVGDIRNIVQESIRKSQLRNIDRLEDDRMNVPFDIGDLVLLTVPIRTLEGKKFDYIRDGPYRVTRKFDNPNIYEIVNLKGIVQHQLVNVERLEKYVERDLNQVTAPTQPLLENIENRSEFLAEEGVDDQRVTTEINDQVNSPRQDVSLDVTHDVTIENDQVNTQRTRNQCRRNSTSANIQARYPLRNRKWIDIDHV